MTILIVEDDAEMRRFIRSLVAELADVTYESRDGADAVARYELSRPDWVLMDLRLPNMDGLEATRRIRSRHPEARIIMVSNHDDADLRRVAADAGVYKYVSKRDLLSLPGLMK